MEFSERTSPLTFRRFGHAINTDEVFGTHRERDKIVSEGYTVLANIGDQDSDLKDLKDKSAECPFRLPNPYYFIP